MDIFIHENFPIYGTLQSGYIFVWIKLALDEFNGFDNIIEELASYV